MLELSPGYATKVVKPGAALDGHLIGSETVMSTVIDTEAGMEAGEEGRKTPMRPGSFVERESEAGLRAEDSGSEGDSETSPDSLGGCHQPGVATRPYEETGEDTRAVHRATYQMGVCEQTCR